jgi:8-oxo-dGTP pyrophosphatase MutT (NUDIX family)
MTRTRRSLEIPDFRRAAVLVPIVLEPELTLILTQRTADVPTHKGQIAFPGGKTEPGETAIDAALREAHEEINLSPELVRVLGWLHDVWTPFAFQVTPIVGIVSSTLELRPNPREVERILLVPIAELASIQPREEQREVPLSGRTPPGETGTRAILHYDWRGVDIWGMTAFVVHDFLEVLRGANG